MKNRIMSFMLIIFIIIGFIPNNVQADEKVEENKKPAITTDAQIKFDEDDKNKNASEDEQDLDSLKTGIYKLNYKAYKDGTVNTTQEPSSISKYIEEAVLRITKDKKIVRIKYNSADMISKLNVQINGEEKSLITVKEEDNYVITEFEVESLNSYISLGLTVTVNMPSYGTMVMAHRVDFVIDSVEITEEDENKISIADGYYDLNYSIYKDGTIHTTQEESKVAKNVEKAVLKVKGKKALLSVTFNTASMLKNLNARVNNKEKNVTITKEGEEYVTMEFEIDSIHDYINLGFTVTSSYYTADQKIDFRINEIVYGKEPNEEKDKIADGNYTIEANLYQTGTTIQSSAAGFFEKEASLKVENGQYIFTLYTKNINMMSNIALTVDGKAEKHEITTKSNGLTGISFPINAVGSNILFACHVEEKNINYSSDVDFNVSLDGSTLKDDSGNNVVVPDESKIPVYENASYKVINSIVGANGLAAAAYLDPNSIIQVEDGVIYLNLTFNKSGFMDGRYITLNSNTSATRYTITNGENKTAIKFAIGSEKDIINISSVTKSIDEGFSISLNSDSIQKITTDTDSENSKDDIDNEEDDDDDDDDELEDGVYTIKNKTYKEKSDTTSDARGYVDDESVILVEDGKMYLVLKFTHGKMMSDTSIKVEGKSKSYDTVKKSGNKYYIKYRINKLSDVTMVTTTIDTGVPSIGVIKDVKFRVLLRKSTLEEDDDADDDFNDDHDDDDDEDTEEDSDEEDAIIDNYLGSVENIIGESFQGSISETPYKKASYKVKNEIVTESSIGYQAARGAVNNVSYYEIENDKEHYITLGLSQTDIMNNLRLSIDGQNVEYSTVSENTSAKTREIRFKIPSLSKQITVTTYVKAMGRDISFGIKFLESTLELISIEESETPINSNNIAGTLTNGNGLGSGEIFASTLEMNSPSKNLLEHEIIEETEDLVKGAKEYFKRYTINNEVISNSSIGRSMARKYLNETSIIEEIDGKYYATITFSSADSMGKFKIQAGGKSVNHSVVLNENGVISLRFPIENINDNITVGIYINPMKMNISFGIRFLEDTMVLIEEGIVNGEEGETDAAAKNLSSYIPVSNNSNNLSVWKIAIVTALLSTLFNVITFTCIYLFIQKRKKKKIFKNE